jgi:hypothetical protein
VSEAGCDGCVSIGCSELIVGIQCSFQTFVGFDESSNELFVLDELEHPSSANFHS